MARLRFAKIASETAPPVGQLSLYAKLDDNLYIQTELGAEYQLLTSQTPGPGPGGGGYTVEEFQLTLGDILAKQVTLSATPALATNTILMIAGAPSPGFYGLDYTVTGNTLSWDTLSLDGVLSVNDLIKVIYCTDAPPSGFTVEQFSIDITELFNKEVVLSSTPTQAQNTLLVIEGAPSTGFYGLDFTVTGNVLSWNGTGLDGLIELNDLIQVIYY